MVANEEEIATGIIDYGTLDVAGTIWRHFCQQCSGFNFSLAEECVFTEEWNEITQATIFTNAFTSSSIKTLPKRFTLPPNLIRTPVYYSMSDMFLNCTQLQDIANFNLPQKLTGIGSFGYGSMFSGCSSLTIPADAPFCFPPAIRVGPQNFLTASTEAPPMGKTATAIINGGFIPTSRNATFRTGGQDNDDAGRARWSDWDSLHINWK
jgi:hypothetical protein